MGAQIYAGDSNALKCRLGLLWTAAIQSMKDPQRDWSSWESLGVSFYRYALKNPSEFPIRIRFAVQALHNAAEIADWDAAPKIRERIGNELIYLEELEGNFLFLNDTFATARVRVLNSEGGIEGLDSRLWSPDLITEALAGTAGSSDPQKADFERVRLETENMMAALKTSFLMLKRFPDDFLRQYFRDPNSMDSPDVGELIYAAAPILMRELMDRIFYLLEHGEISDGLERIDQLLRVILLLPSDSRPLDQIHSATGELTASDVTYHRYEVGMRVVDSFILWSPLVLREVEARSLDFDRQDIIDRWSAIARALVESDGQESLESSSQTRLYLLRRLGKI